LVVDVQNDFCHERGAMGRLGFDMGAVQSSVRALAQFVESARLSKVPVIFVATQHSEITNSESWLTRGPRRGGEICAVGSWGAECYRLTPAHGEPVVIKHRYSGFVGTDLGLVLHPLELKRTGHGGIHQRVCRVHDPRRLYARLLRSVGKRLLWRLNRSGTRSHNPQRYQLFWAGARLKHNHQALVSDTECE
jgi:nicotinamidase-related amidase